jgi:hypothetical protein
MKAGAPDLVCGECWEEFDVESSPDLERCQRCAEEQAWMEGALLVLEPPRAGKSAGGADLINGVPAGRDRMGA